MLLAAVVAGWKPALQYARQKFHGKYFSLPRRRPFR